MERMVITNELGYMGSSLRTYVPQKNINSAIHSLFPKRKVLTTQSIVLGGTKEIPDVSFYQGKINWDIMRQKTDAIFIRAGQNIWKDPWFDINYSESKKRGMYRGVYYFFDDRATPKQQVDTLRFALGDDVPEMEIVCDWERRYGGAYFSLGYAVEFMQRLAEYYPNKDAFYTGYYFFRDNSNPVANAAQYNYLKNKKLWLAWYTSNPAYVLVPLPWSKLHLWQRGTPAVDYGQESIEIDMNVFNDTDDNFYRMYGGVTPPPPPPTGENMIVVSKVTTPGLNGRSAAGTANPIIAALKEGDVLVCDGEQTVDGALWRRVMVCVRAGVTVPLPAGGVWASDGGTGSLQGELDAFIPSSEKISSIATNQSIRVEYADGTFETFQKDGMNLPKV